MQWQKTAPWCIVCGCSDERIPLPSLAQYLRRSPLPALMCAVIAPGFQSSLRAEISEAVSSLTNGHYSRAKLPDGSPQVEYYSFGDGGMLGSASSSDAIDKLTFSEVAYAAVGPLARHNYRAAVGKKPEQTKLLIMVYWGTTNAPSGANTNAAYQRLQDGQAGLTPPPPPDYAFMAHCSCDPSQMDTNSGAAGIGAKESETNSAFATMVAADRARQRADMRLAVLLGYDSELIEANSAVQTAFRNRKQDLMGEIERSRDFVVLIAYDFQDLWKYKRRNLLWVTRMSVPEQGLTFRDALPGMVVSAADYFGQDSHGLVREYVREGRVDVGDVKDLGEVATK